MLKWPDFFQESFRSDPRRSSGPKRTSTASSNTGQNVHGKRNVSSGRPVTWTFDLVFRLKIEIVKKQKNGCLHQLGLGVAGVCAHISAAGRGGVSRTGPTAMSGGGAGARRANVRAHAGRHGARRCVLLRRVEERKGWRDEATRAFCGVGARSDGTVTGRAQSYVA